MELRNDPRLRAIASRAPALLSVYHAAHKRLIRLQGSARLDYAGAPLTVRADTRDIVDLRIRPVEKEPWTVAWIERNLREGDTLYDIGANIGVYSLIAAAACPGASVVAFEPAYATYASLCENVQRNRVADRVVPLSVVLGETTRLGSLAYSGTGAGAAVHELDGAGGAYDQPVLVFALDDLVAHFSLTPPTLIKLDVDGAEAAVLAGARETLRRPELRSLIVEIEERQTDGVLAALRDAGFTLGERVDERAGEPLPGVWYGVFSR